MAQTHYAIPKATFEMIEGVQMSGKRQPNYQINKQGQQTTGPSGPKVHKKRNSGANGK